MMLGPKALRLQLDQESRSKREVTPLDQLLKETEDFINASKDRHTKLDEGVEKAQRGCAGSQSS